MKKPALKYSNVNNEALKFSLGVNLKPIYLIEK